MSDDPLAPLPPVEAVAVEETVELDLRRDPLRVALDLIRSASLVTMAVALVVIAFALT